MTDPTIDAFIDALWLEEGLSRNTLAAYRRDLALFAAWPVNRWLLSRGRGHALVHAHHDHH